MKYRIGTVFSGIGCAEQALKRLKINHEIIFACDNGNIDIDIDIDKELNKIKSLKSISEKKEYANSIYENKTKKKNFVEISYKENYKIIDNNFFYDIKLMDGADYHGKLDIFIGGSPCQSFSAIGSRGGFEDTRGTLFYDYIRLINEIKPKVFIYENVYGVLTHSRGETWKIMQKSFIQLGYHFEFKILNSKDFGIPQSRRRMFVVGFKNKKDCDNFMFPDSVKLKYTMQDFLLDNCSFGNFKSINEKIILKKTKGIIDEKLFLSDKLKNYVLSPGTKNFMHKEAKINLPIARAILSTQGNTHRSSVNNYVLTDNKIRSLDPRESHRLMGFPDTYNIVVSKAQAYKQSGNSIVVDVMMSVMKNIINALGKDDE